MSCKGKLTLFVTVNRGKTIFNKLDNDNFETFFNESSVHSR